MYETAKSRNMKIDPAEEKYHFLLHQRISKIIAEERFGIIDKEILSAVECHTTLKKNAGMYYDILKSKAAESLDDACYYFIRYQFDNGLLLMPHQWLNEAYEELKKSQNT